MTEHADPSPESENENERNLGTQPLDAIMLEHGQTNQSIVAASREPLTHKAVQRARKGRMLTPHTQRRVVAALNASLKSAGIDRAYAMADLFTYKALDKGKTLPLRH